MSIRFFSTCALALVVAQGCADDANGGADAPSAETHAAALSAATCDAIFACPPSSELGAFRALFPDGPTGCAATFSQRAAQDRVRERIARSGGALRFDARAAARCYERIRSTCSLQGDAAEACARVLRGASAEGAECNASAECAEGSYCVRDAGRSCGVCRPTVPIGAPCNETAQCDPRGAQGRTLCNWGQPGGPRCVDVVAGADADEGEACGHGWTGLATVAEVRCRPGLRCAGSGAAGVSAPASAGVCVRACAESDGTGGLTCRTRPWKHREGDACDSAGVTGVCNPLRRLECRQGACHRVVGGEGASCAVVGTRDAMCDPGLVCAPDRDAPATPLRCRRPAAEGSRCLSDDECLSGSCSGVPSTCQASACAPAAAPGG